jgi:hypothetical protein
MDVKLVYGVIETTGILNLKIENSSSIFLPRFILGKNITGPYIFKTQLEKKIESDNLSPICRCTGDLKDFIMDLINNKNCQVSTYFYRLLYEIANENLEFKNVNSKKIKSIYHEVCKINSITDEKQKNELLSDNAYLHHALKIISETILKNSIKENELIIHSLSKPQPTLNVPFEIWLNDTENFFDSLTYHSICVNVHYLNKEFSEPIKLSEILEKRSDYCLNYNLCFIKETSCYAVNKLYDLKSEISKISF